MTVVLIHLGSRLPAYLWLTVKQVRKYFSGRIIVYGSDEVTDPSINGCQIIGASSGIEDSARCKDYERTSFIGEFGQFWSYAFKRLFILEEITRRENLSNVLHIENDVAIFSDPSKLSFAKHCAGRAGMTVCPATNNHAMYAYTWIRDHESIHRANNASLAILQEGRPVLAARYNDGGFVNEMHIASQLLQVGILTALPILPFSDNSVVMLGGIFDGAALGQYVAGTPNDPPGFCGDHRHWMGKAFAEKRYGVQWINGEPYLEDLVQPSAWTKIHNLHVHSKKMELVLDR